MSDRRLAAIGGIVGPIGFVGAWALGGLLTDGYDPLDDAISRLAAVGAGTRPLMTAGFAVFGVGVATYATALGRFVSRRAAVASAITAASTLAVAALPLDVSWAVDRAHSIAAAIGYASLAAVPLLAARPLVRQGRTMLAEAAIGAGAVAAASLAISLTSAPTGLFQRVGLTVVDAWIVASAVVILAGRPDAPTADTG